MSSLIGPNASLDRLDCHECQPQQHYFTNSQTSLRCPRGCHSFWDLHSPFKFVLRALWNKKRLIWASYTDYLFFPVLTTVPFWTVSSWSGHGHGRMGFGKSYCRNWRMGLNLRIWSKISFLNLCLWICIYIYSCAQNKFACIYIGYTYSYMHVHVYIYIYVYVYVYIFIFVYIHTYMHVYMFVYIFFICMYV